ncbi:UDP-N-acetylmuramate dehydrogenase [Sansalvadorimonas sp. 2012CJ34-2]|uniref:UDP-N-acetylenolpyruvoylglucosamine reductase n=1 Tax=Parendozoicomonas callyspongiae TaxID=2942213 RepID=A0ABT0PER2_9GAMM|nr:UDP-N-acetylmuramate dehydrogenase [Sansalvadorimonas sp. 2012CJ34-2]
MSEIQKPQWLKENIDLKSLNTMGLSVSARFFAEVHSLEELQAALQWARLQQVAVFPLGGGSNVVLAGDYDGLVILIRIIGRQVLKVNEESNQILVKTGAGENWHQLVRWTLQQNAYGLENLSLIPGCVGAAPIQNIGAYGVEIKDVFHSLEGLDIQTGQIVVMGAEECSFGYRDSVFKGECLDRFIITSVTFALSREFQPCLGYGHLQKEVLKAAGTDAVTGRLVSDTICRIREEKLPDPEMVGNAGSFFKNPVINEQLYQELSSREPDLVAYPAGEGLWKLAAGWLIDRCGFRGLAQDNGAGVYEHQALVLVNRGGASGRDILELAENIKQAVLERFQVELEMEPRTY